MTPWGRRKDGQAYQKTGKKGIKSSSTSPVTDVYLKNAKDQNLENIEKQFVDYISKQDRIKGINFGDRIDLLLVEQGLKPMAEIASTENIDELLYERGLQFTKEFVEEDGGNFVYNIARSENPDNDVNFMMRPKRGIKNNGRLFGYPECCVNKFFEERVGRINTPKRYWKQLAEKGNYIPNELIHLDHIPCSPECEESILRGKAINEILESNPNIDL